MLLQETIAQLLGDSLEQMTKLVPHLCGDAAKEKVPALAKDYRDLLKRLEVCRDDDPRLADEGWSWIWEEDAETLGHSPLQLYGRLQFINSELFHFL